MNDFQRFVDQVLEGIKGIATDDLQGLLQAATNDVRSFLERSEEKLKTRTDRLKRGEIPVEDFEDFVKVQLDLAAMFSLTQAGIGAARMQQFRDAVIKLVVDRAVSVFL